MDKKDGIRPPGAISFKRDNLADTWGKNYQQFEWYLYAIKTVAGLQAQEVYGTFTYGTDESPKTYADVMNKFMDYCMPKNNIVYERFVFNTCNQNQGQTIDSYVTKLRMKAHSCEYDELKDSLIRDRIVVGTTSTKLQEKMIQDKTRTLQSAISLCKSAETTRRQMKALQEKWGALHGNGGTMPVNVIKRDLKGMTQEKR